MDPFRNGAAGVVSPAKLFRPEDFAELTTPSAALFVASQLLVDAAATPPLRGGELSRFNSFTASRPPLQQAFPNDCAHSQLPLPHGRYPDRQRSGTNFPINNVGSRPSLA